MTSELFWQSVFLVSPFIFLACIPILNNAFTQRQVGIAFQAFAVIPVGLELWQRVHRSTWYFSWYVLNLRNLISQRGWKRIAGWFDRHYFALSKWVIVYLMAVAITFYFVGLLLQLFS
jgi:hypothetical protein